MVLRSAPLHDHHRHLPARGRDPAPQRLCRCRRLRHPRGRRRGPEADRRRHAGDLPRRRPGRACRARSVAERLAGERVAALNQRRIAEGQPWTEAYLGLHVGEVFYGNIGSEDRLDFTVVGPAVNEASRIAAMCRSVDRRSCSPRPSTPPPAPEDRPASSRSAATPCAAWPSRRSCSHAMCPNPCEQGPQLRAFALTCPHRRPTMPLISWTIRQIPAAR